MMRRRDALGRRRLLRHLPFKNYMFVEDIRSTARGADPVSDRRPITASRGHAACSPSFTRCRPGRLSAGRRLPGASAAGATSTQFAEAPAQAAGSISGSRSPAGRLGNRTAAAPACASHPAPQIHKKRMNDPYRFLGTNDRPATIAIRAAPAAFVYANDREPRHSRPSQYCREGILAVDPPQHLAQRLRPGKARRLYCAEAASQGEGACHGGEGHAAARRGRRQYGKMR